MKTTGIYILLIVTLLSCSIDKDSNTSGKNSIVYFEELTKTRNTSNSDFVELWQLNKKTSKLVNTNIQITKEVKDSTSNYMLMTTSSISGVKIDSLILPTNLYESTIINRSKDGFTMSFIGDKESIIKSHIKILIKDDGFLNNNKVQQIENSDSIFSLIPSIYAYEITAEDSTRIMIEKSKGLEINTFSFTLNVISPLKCRTQYRNYIAKDSIIDLDGLSKSTFTYGKKYFKIELIDFKPKCFDESINLDETYHR